MCAVPEVARILSVQGHVGYAWGFQEQHMQTVKQVGVVGLGAMGQGMAGSLRRAGYEVYVCDARPGVAEAFAAQGGVACASPAEVAKSCQVLVSVVVNAAQTEEVLFGPQGAAAHLAQGSVFVMCSTVDPNWSVALEARLEALGLHYVDAPISGGAAKAASGQMTMMTAGNPAAYALAEPLLNAMAAKVYKLGDSAGAGSKVKIINQLLAGVHIAAAAEAMALGLREGVDPAALYEVITHSAGNSWMFENRMAHVLAADYTPLSAVDIFVKDLGIVLDMARSSKFPLPLSATAHQMFMQASTAGFAKEDDSAVIKIFPGIELPKAKE
jgi:3-hydroxyisobutyrate dehydrogenase